MNYIVLDLEWNQSSNSNNSNSDKLQFEIIEIGAVKLNSNMQKIDSFEELIKPQLYKKIHPIIENITKLTAEDLEKSRGFVEVCSEFINWCGKDYILCTYGSQDLMELQKNMKYYCINNPWHYPLKYYDVQRLFSIQNNLDENNQKSLEKAVNFLNIEEKADYHRALVDSIYTSEILKTIQFEIMENNYTIDYFGLPKSIDEEIDFYHDKYSELFTSKYIDRDELINRKDLFITRCPICRRKCRKKLRWFADNNKYLCIANCDKHGYIEGVLNIKKSADGEYFGIRKISMADTKKFEQLTNRKDNIREKRRIRRHNQTGDNLDN